MTQATKTLSVIFILSVVLALTLRFTTRQSTSDLLGSEILTFERDLVNRITVHNDDIGNVTLELQDSVWTVTNSDTEQAFETEPNAVENALGSIENLTVRSLLTRNPGQHVRYEVDDTTGTVVELHQDDTRLGGLVLGGINFVSQSEYNTYIRATDSDDVYAVSGFITSQFNKNITDWRNKTVWEVPQGQIRQINFEYPADSSFTIVRGANPSEWLTPAGDSVQTSASTQLISSLSRFRAQGFTGDAAPGLPAEPLYQIRLNLDSGQQYTLSVIHGTEANEYIAEADNYPYIITLGTSFQNAVLLSRDEILVSPE